MPSQIIQPITADEKTIKIIQWTTESELGVRVQWKTAFLLAAVKQILKENERYGKVTVRQVYYQLVTRNVIENSAKNYQNYVTHLTTGRKGGVIPWDAFEDRARMFYREPFPQYDIDGEGDPQEALKLWFEYALNPKVSKEYDLAKWSGQPYFVELWIEKDALAGFLSPICQELGVGLVVSRGYTSYTFKQEAIRRFNKIREEDREPILLYLGDLDPSGYDIFRCLKDEIDGTVERIGLDPRDVSQFGLASNPIKDDDSRANGFRRLFPELGDKVYELDALPPGELRDRARRNILRYFDQSIADENDKNVRHWRANFTRHQTKIRKILKGAGIEIEN